MKIQSHGEEYAADLSPGAARAVLFVLVLAAVCLRIPGLFWLIGFGPAQDYSFNTDDQRFVDLAKNFSAGMPDGYVHGMTTHLLALRAIVEPFFPNANLLQLLKVITLAYAGATVWLTYVIAREWEIPRKWAAVSAFFLATAPMHVACSNFGTADVTAVFYFYLTLLMQRKYLCSKQQLWFVLSAVLTGIAIAVKFFLPLLVPLALVTLAHKGRQLFTQTLVAVFVAVGSFQAISLFEYSANDLFKLISVLQTDNVSITSANGVIKQFVLYVWDFVSAISLPVSVLLIAGVFLSYSSIRAALVSLSATDWSDTRQLRLADWRRFLTPEFLLFAALAAHGLLLVIAGIHAARHILVFVPLAAIGAARTLQVLANHVGGSRGLGIAGFCALGVYMAANAGAVERLYATDVRAELSNAAVELNAQGREVLTFSGWSPLRGIRYEPDFDMSQLNPDAYLASCDMEYLRYLRGRVAAELYAVYGGQERLEFFWNVFQGQSPFVVRAEFRQRPISPEQWLIDRQILRPIGTYVPKRCVLIGPGTSADSNIARPDLWPPVYYTAGW